MTQELDILKLVTGQLESKNIPYMITGSIAMNFYAVPRMTRDIDIVVEAKVEHVDSLEQLFGKDFYFDKETVCKEIKKRGMFNIIHHEAIVKIDFIIRKESDYRELEFKRRRQVNLGETPIWIVSAEDLILSKLFWAKDSLSEMQLKDVKNIFQNVPNLDRHYIGKWVDLLGLYEVHERVKE